MKLAVLLLLAACIGFLLGRWRSSTRQNRGEAAVRNAIQSNFASPDYHLLNNVTLRLEDGTTQIDHILVSRFGVFVIETKDYRGWIFANAQHATWTQVLFRAKFRFQNPIFQNLRHVRAVKARLDFLPAGTIQSAVVFTGDAEFKTPMPAGVFTLREFVDHVRERTTEPLSENRVQFSVGRLETARLAITRQTDVEHVRDLQRRHSRT
ncbi:MAG: nuclease-related domain-containing protein [Steroidobacteraceae bacterium]